MEKDGKRGRELLCIQDFGVSFLRYERRTARRRELPVISELDVTVREGEIVAVVGSSGSGKSLLAHAVCGILPENAAWRGTIRFQGETVGEEEIKRLRGKEIALAPQSVNCLDPLMKAGMQITNGKKDAASLAEMRELCRRYGLDARAESCYPFELSGGMARRVLLLAALMSKPRLIIADEPTPGMELALAKKVMEDFRTFADEGNGVLLITHDLELALEAADRILVFYAGTTVEHANASDFTCEELLRHPYTKALYRAMPRHGFKALPGTQPYAAKLPKGCPFGPRCPQRTEECGGKIPVCEVRGGMVKCVLYRQEGGADGEA